MPASLTKTQPTAYSVPNFSGQQLALNRITLLYPSQDRLKIPIFRFSKSDVTMLWSPEPTKVPIARICLVQNAISLALELVPIHWYHASLVSQSEMIHFALQWLFNVPFCMALTNLLTINYK